MSKLDALSSKIADLKTKLNEKLDNIAFIKKLRAPAAPKAPDPHALSKIYTEGGTQTRLLVLSFYLLMAACALSSLYVGKKFYDRLKSGNASKAAEQHYAKQIDQLSEKVRESASIVSIGKLTVNTLQSGQKVIMSVDIWARFSDPEAAAFAQNNDTKVYDKTIEVFDELFRKNISILDESGKQTARAAIKDTLNSLLKKGKAEEVFFYNMISQ